MLNLSGEVLRLCLRVLLNGAGAGLGHSTKGSQGRVLCERELFSRLLSVGWGTSAHLDFWIQASRDPSAFRACFFVKVGTKVKHVPFWSSRTWWQEPRGGHGLPSSSPSTPFLLEQAG